MTRLPSIAFASLVLATVAAFFITQHLKVSTPLLAGFPRPVPAAIDPVRGTYCYDPAVGKTLNYRQMTISFYLQNQSDSVDVWVTDSHERRVATLASGTYMPGGTHPVRKQFTWNGHDDNGALAPDGEYYVRVRLRHQQRTIPISDSSGPIPFRVITTPPRPAITRLDPQVIHASAPSPVRIDYAGNGSRLATVLIYRLAAPRRPELVKSFITGGHSALWNGQIRNRPASPGTYVIGLKVTDAACHTVYFPPPLVRLAVAATKVTVLP